MVHPIKLTQVVGDFDAIDQVLELNVLRHDCIGRGTARILGLEPKFGL